jgi:hypothetical protein
MARMDFMEPAGNRWWPIFGAVFLVSAVKRQQGIRLIGLVQGLRIPAITQLNPVAESRQQLVNKQDRVN